jgi:hypothetical protein
MSKEQTPIDIQTELTRMYSQYGWSEMFLYKAQLLFESELDKKTNAKLLEALEEVKDHIEKQPKLYPLSLWAKLSIMKDEATKQK